MQPQAAAATFPTPSFWRDFSARHWEKASLLLRRPFGGPFVDPARAFAAVVKACQRFRAGEAVRVRLFAGSALVACDLDRLLPAPDDRSFAGYAARMGVELGSPFTLVVNYLHAEDVALWNTVRRFLSGLYAQVGLPADHADVDVFVSNNKATPFGIHRDPASNFTMVLAGRKRMRLWPEAFFARRPAMDQASYAGYLERATTLEGEAGDLLYWPSQDWHVGESTGELSVALNVSLYLAASTDSPGCPPGELLGQRVRELLVRRLGAAGGVPTYALRAAGLQQSGEALPAALDGALEALHALEAEGAVARDLAGIWLGRLSAWGFNRLPAARSIAPLREDEQVRLDPEFPVLWRRIGGEVAVSGNGRTMFLAAPSSEVPDLVDRLNTGAPLAVAEAVGGSPTAATLRDLLHRLCGWGCLEREAAAERRAERPAFERAEAGA